MRSLVGTTFSCVVALAGVVQAAAGPVELKPRFQPGQKVYVEIDEHGKQTVQADMMGPNPVEMFSRSIYGFYQEPLSADGADARLKITFDRRLMQFRHPTFGDMLYDSDTGAKPSTDNSISLIAGPFVGKTLTMTVKGSRVIKVEGFDALQRAIDQSAGGDMFYQNVRKSIDEKALSKDLIESQLQILPAKLVDVGDTWNNTFESDDSFLGKTVSHYKCKLDRLDQHDGRPVATISYEATTELAPGSQPPVNPMGMVPALKNMKTTGTALFDVERGLILSRKSTTTGTIQMAAPASDAQGGSTPAVTFHITNEVATRTLSPQQREVEKKKHKATTTPPTRTKPDGG